MNLLPLCIEHLIFQYSFHMQFSKVLDQIEYYSCLEETGQGFEIVCFNFDIFKVWGRNLTFDECLDECIENCMDTKIAWNLLKDDKIIPIKTVRIILENDYCDGTFGYCPDHGIY